jgi:hypothetical protein
LPPYLGSKKKLENEPVTEDKGRMVCDYEELRLKKYSLSESLEIL